MARPLLFTLDKQNLPIIPFPISFFVILVAIICIFSIVTSLCASHHKTKKLHKPNDENFSSSPSPSESSSSERRLLSKLNSKALLMVKMVSWKKLHEEYEDDDESEEAVWKKSIIMGERCRPLEFSGKIEYDCQGNIVLDQSGKSVPLKS